MTIQPLQPYSKNRYKCIGCAYLCIYESYKGTYKELGENGRYDVALRDQAAANFHPGISCYHGVIEPDEIQGQSGCKKKWKPYTPGILPERTLQTEHHRANIKLIWATIVISAVILIATILFGILDFTCN